MFICQSLTGSLFIIESKDKLNELKQTLSPFGISGLLWAGFRNNGSSTRFWSIDGKISLPADITGWAWGEPNGAIFGIENCLAIDLVTWLLSDVDCDSQLMNVCAWTKTSTPTLFHFRGAENVSQFLDTQYLFIAVDGDRSIFQGLSYTRIVFKQDSWVIENITSAAQLGRCDLSFEFPLGVCKWAFIDNTTAELNLNGCLEDQYTCMDSQCLSEEDRCNQQTDCTYVTSDEDDCNIVIIPSGYNKVTPPEAINKGLTGSINISISVVILGLLGIDINNNLFTVKFQMVLGWNDYRLTMLNLLNDSDSNSLSYDQWSNIWVPVIKFNNSRESVLSNEISNDDSSSVFIVRRGKFNQDNRNSLQQDFIFNGSQQVLFKRSFYTVDFICTYDLQWYPLDSQFCKMNLSVMATASQTINIIPGGLFAFLTDFGIGSFNMSHFTYMISSDNDSQMVVLGFQFQRQYGPVFLSTVLPTLVLTIINQITNYFLGPEMFESIVAMNATVLMTLSSIFISYFQTLPPSNTIR
jgi:hypothetical protein